MQRPRQAASDDNPVFVTLDDLTVENGSAGHGNAPVQVESGYCIMRLSGDNRLVGGWHEITLKADEGVAGLRVLPVATCVITSAGGAGSSANSTASKTPSAGDPLVMWPLVLLATASLAAIVRDLR